MIPFRYLLRWPDRQTESASWQSGSFLAAIAGATIAAGFWTLQNQAWMAVRIVLYPHLQFFLLVTAAVVLMVCFVSGTAISSMLALRQERKQSGWIYGLVLMLEACLLTGCGLLGAHSANHERVFLALGAILFSFLLGLQNVMVTSSLSKEHGTNHIGGIVTELGIGLGNLIYEVTTKKIAGKQLQEEDRTRLTLLASIVGFFCGGVFLGTLGFNQLGFLFYLLLAAFLFFVSTASLLADRLSA